MAYKISFGRIIADHYKSLHNTQTGKPDLSDWITFVGAPVLISAILVWSKVYIGNNALPILVTALAIFVGLLINVNVLLFDIVRTQKVREIKKDVVKEVLATISFSILLSLWNIVLLLFTLIPAKSLFIVNAINFTCYFFLLLFLSNLLMILKRMYVLFIDEINTEIQNP